ncbi:MAG TPA: alpha/beta hydrolase [Trueperaceae bacterium]|nr:alpha/beta hydrolase [Trueperaceae bacterium]
MLKTLLPLTLALTAGLAGQALAQQTPTIVLVHGAFADSSGWYGVISDLEAAGYTAIAVPNQLRSVASDAASVAAVLRSIPGPVVLVGHSYGGPVITEAAVGQPNVIALVYVAAFAPDLGESSLTLSSMFPGSTLGEALQPVELADGGQDLFIQVDKFPQQFAADVPVEQAELMAVTQRPVTLTALAEPTVGTAWKTLPSYFIYGSDDLNIPAQVLAFMAERASARETRVISGASHAVMVSHPHEVAAMIIDAAEGR